MKSELMPHAVSPKGAATCQPRAKRNGVSREAPPWVGNPINVRSPERAKPVGERGSVFSCALSGLKTSLGTVSWGGAALCPRLVYCCPFGANMRCLDTTWTRRVGCVALLLFLLITGCGKDQTYRVPGLTKMLEHSDHEKRCTAAELLGAYGAEAKPAVPQLTQALKDSHPSVRLAAAYALAAIGPDSESALPTLIEMLKDQDPEVRLAAVYAMPTVGLTAPTTLPALQQAQRDRDEQVRQGATTAIRKLESAAKYRKAAAAPPSTK